MNPIEFNIKSLQSDVALAVINSHPSVEMAFRSLDDNLFSLENGVHVAVAKAMQINSDLVSSSMLKRNLEEYLTSVKLNINLTTGETEFTSKVVNDIKGLITRIQDM